MGRGGPRERDDEPGVVDELAVPVEQPAAQPVLAQRRAELLGLDRGQPARRGQRAARRAGAPAEQVGDPQPGGHRDRVGPGHGRGQRHHDRQRVDQVRRGPAQQDVPFGRALHREARVAAGQVAQSAVHQLRAPPAGAPGQVVRLDEGDRQAPAGRVERDAGAGDPAADDQQVDGLAVGDPGQFARPPRRGQRPARPRHRAFGHSHDSGHGGSLPSGREAVVRNRTVRPGPRTERARAPGNRPAHVPLNEPRWGDDGAGEPVGS
jgi:hypothetical protein